MYPRHWSSELHDGLPPGLTHPIYCPSNFIHVCSCMTLDFQIFFIWDLTASAFVLAFPRLSNMLTWLKLFLTNLPLLFFEWYEIFFETAGSNIFGQNWCIRVRTMYIHIRIIESCCLYNVGLGNANNSHMDALQILDTLRLWLNFISRSILWIAILFRAYW